MTDSIKKFLAVSEYRRQKQLDYNREHNITPRSVTRAVEGSLSLRSATANTANHVLRDATADFDVTETVRELEAEMLEAANNLEFEKAALLRDQIRELKRSTSQPNPDTTDSRTPTTYPSPAGALPKRRRTRKSTK
jgi:excinuclease ABC subunit B